MRYFNVAGPCNPHDHYMIAAQDRLHGVEQLIESKQYFVIHAARQSGKTTYLLDLTQRLNAEGKYYALYCSLENVQGVIEAEKGIPAILDIMVYALQQSNIPYLYDNKFENNRHKYLVVLNMFLSDVAKSLDKPLVLFFDEADCLSESTLISFLRQLRNGYNSRTAISFVHSLALAGMRNIRDFKAHVRPDSDTLGSASPFNIATKVLTIHNFSKDEIIELYAQHTTESGQLFESNAIDLIWEKTQGQPWLVNAVAREVVEDLLNRDYSKPVTAELCEQAIRNIILRRDVHIDSLLERLKEPRVQRVIEPLLLGEDVNNTTDDFYYARDLGLIRITPGKIEPANPIYSEVMTRTLNSYLQDSIRYEFPETATPRYIKDGRIDMDFLMTDFQQFWRENSAIWEEKIDYKEAAPHLVLMAFLQRVINGGGNIIREYAAGRRFTDLCVLYDGQKYPIELKLQRAKNTLEKGLVQLADYMDTFDEKYGWLCIFDRNSEKSWEEKIYLEKYPLENGKTITVVGL